MIGMVLPCLDGEAVFFADPDGDLINHGENNEYQRNTDIIRIDKQCFCTGEDTAIAVAEIIYEQGKRSEI